MKIYLPPLEPGEEEGFTPATDLFGKASLAAGMTNLVSVADDPLVIAFDGVWGSGKTTFLKMWAGDLRKDGYPVIYFDAFENDYIEDAFAALARELVRLVDSNISKVDKNSKKIKEKAVELGAQILRGTAKVGAKAAIRSATLGLVDADDLKGMIEDVVSEAGDIAEMHMKELLDNPRKQQETVTSFRDTLGGLPSLISPPQSGEAQKPLVFIVDELDRCKPLFALAVLERIKHFMVVPNVHFVLGTHLKQLEGSIRYAYGPDIDARSYLQKFINLTVINNDNQEKYDQGDLEKYAAYLAKQLNLEQGHDSPVEASVNTIIRLVRHQQASFRTIERAFSILTVSLAFTSKDKLRLGAIMGGLVMMKLLEPELFIRAKRGQLTLAEAKAFLQFVPDEGREQEMGWEESWWTYSLCDTLPEHLQEYGRSLEFSYGFRNRRDIVSHTATNVIDKLSTS